jgi:hypothetical protein
MAEDILATITAQRVLDVAAARASVPASSLEARISSSYPAPPLDLCAVVRAAPGLLLVGLDPGPAVGWTVAILCLLLLLLLAWRALADRCLIWVILYALRRYRLSL